MSGRRALLALSLLLLLSLWLRLLHIDFGLPDAYQPDEVAGVAETQRLLEGHYELHRYSHPPLLKNLAFVGLKVLQLAGEGQVPQLAVVHLGLRLVSAISGVAAVAAVYLLAGCFVDRWLALLAAALYAVLPLTVINAKYAVPDTLLSFLFTLSLWLHLRLYQRPTVMRYGFTGLFLGLAVGAKYNGAFLACSALAADFLGRRRGVTDRPAVANGSALAAVLLGGAVGLAVSFPLLPFEWRDVARGGLSELLHLFVRGHRGFTVSGRDEYYLYHFQHSVLPAAGPLLLGAILAGLVYMACMHDARSWIVLAAVVPYYLAIERAVIIPPSPERYVLPLVGPYVLAAVLACGRVFDVVAAARPRARATASLALAALLCAWPAIRTAQLLPALVPDARAVMKTWLLQNLPDGATIWIEEPQAYSPDLSGTRLRVRPLDPTTRFAGRLPRRGDYVLASSFNYDRYRQHPEQQPRGTRFYDDLFRDGTLLHEVAANGRTYLFHNPTLKLYLMR